MNNPDWLTCACAAAFALFYLTQIPVILIAAVYPGGFGVGIGAFLWRGAYLRAKKYTAPNKPSPLSPYERKKLLRCLLRHGNIENFRVTGTVALSDAKNTCLTVGALRAFCAALGKRGTERIYPDFNGGHTRLEICVVLSVRLGYLLLAGMDIARSRLKQYLYLRFLKGR